MLEKPINKPDYKLSEAEIKFNNLVCTSQWVYTKKDVDLKLVLKQIKKKIKILNKDLKPYIDSEYRCRTCGTKGRYHPVTSYCFICDTDNF